MDESNLTRHLESFAASGFGGVEITPIYGARGAEQRYVDFLSPRWLQLVAHTGREAQRLGLGVDMATGTSWPFGGPWLQPADGIQKAVLADGKLTGASTGMKVKRAAPGDEGLVVDPYSPAALGHYLAALSAAFEKFPRELIRSQFHDSFEYYDASWTPELPRVFKEMHGYDLQQFAPALAAKDGESTLPADTLARVRADYRATLAQLHLDYVRTWRDWSHARGWLIRNQAHGAPANLLDLYANADIPEVEVFGSTPFAVPGLRRVAAELRDDHALPESLILRMASSAAHVAGHPLTSCESFTWLREHWKEAPSMMKPEIDRIFAEGINHLVYHGNAYSPPDAAWPGWLFYASTEFNDRNPLWPDFAALNAYVTRVQSILQSGHPDNDVLLYWPAHDVWEMRGGLMKQLEVADTRWMTDTPAGKLGHALLARGYGFDWISDAQLAATVAEPDGALKTSGGTHYRVLVVPATRRMPVETLRQIAALAAAGVPVVLQALPEDVPGYGRLAERRAAFHEQLAALARTRASVVSERTPEAVFATATFTEHARREAIVDAGVSFTRRHRADGTDYFFTNLGANSIDGWITLGVPAADACILDPLTGEEGDAAIRSNRGNAAIYLQLAAGESLIVRTSNEAIASDVWEYTTAADTPSPHILSGPWEVEFIHGGPRLPTATRVERLTSWTELGDADAQRFAGTARYRIEFDFDRHQSAEWALDLGDVRETARVRVNGADAGLAWSLPFQLRIGALLRTGRNVLEIDVTNLAANRIRDLDQRGVKWKIMREINYVDIRYKPFDASKWALTPSGLLGPVRLIPLSHFTPR